MFPTRFRYNLVFGKLLGRLRLLKELNSNIGGKEEIGEKVLTSLRGDYSSLLTSIYR